MFNRGDKVKIVKSDYVAKELQKGSTGTVGYASRGITGIVLDLPVSSALANVEWNFYTDELELV